MAADELSTLEIECQKLPVSVTEVPSNDDHPRPIQTHPIDNSGPDILQLQAMANNVAASTLRLEDSNDVTAEKSLITTTSIGQQ